MNQQLIDFQTAENNLLACATYLTQKIGSSNSHAEAVQEIVTFYLEKDDVDLAAQLADSVEDTFFRDKILIDVAEKSAEIGDDDYALQLADAIEDVGLRSLAIERIAVQKATKNEFEKAFNYIENLNHQSDAQAAIAIHQVIIGNETEALQTIAGIEFPTSKVNALQEIAQIYLQKNETEKSINLLNKAREDAEEIDFVDEKIRALIQISVHFIEADRNDKAIEILAEARSIAETIQGFNGENFLANISIGFLRAGSLDLADRTLDLVANKTLLASVLTSYAIEFDKNGEREEALETLEEAYAILKSEREKEVRDSRSRFGVLSSIAVNFANFNDADRALEIALENPVDSERNSALKQIAQINVLNNNDENNTQIIAAIDDSAEKIFGLIGVSDAYQKLEKTDESLKYLHEAYSHISEVKQNFTHSIVLNWLAKKFYELGEKDKAREISLENLQTISQILDESQKVIALSRLANVYENLEFELNPKEKEIMNIMLRKSEW